MNHKSFLGAMPTTPKNRHFTNKTTPIPFIIQCCTAPIKELTNKSLFNQIKIMLINIIKSLKELKELLFTKICLKYYKIIILSI